ncbi:MAG TPA: hypothetical protein VKE74_31380 [Gemmataceae bacterium]|nr:hypothetical protein [Gemmataceae bacterium]
MSVTILSPRSNDTVTNPVVIVSDFNFTAATNLTCEVVGTGKSDGPANVNGNDLHSSAGLAPDPDHTYTVRVAGSNGDADSQPNINVISGQPPVVIDAAVRGADGKGKAGKTEYTLSGVVDTSTNPKVVVCVAYRVKNKNLIPQDIDGGFPDRDSGEWTAKVNVICNPNDRTIVRVAVLDNAFTVIGTTTRVLTDCK